MTFLEVLITSSTLIFLTEIGDKTMITTMCLGAQHRHPAVVLLVAMLALASSTLIAVVIGFILSSTLPLEFILYLSAALFMCLGIHTLVRKIPEQANGCDNPQTLLSMFSLVFFSELGDKSQIAVLGLAAQSQFPVMVLVGALIGFLIVNSIGAFAGDRLANVISMGTIRKVSGIVFILFGVLMLLGFI
jgi:putative Ca2+/H+ antiporter (TMEM165/GDT1 family)